MMPQDQFHMFLASLVNLFNVTQALGMLVVLLAGWILPWRTMCFVLIAPTVASMVLQYFWMPETPYYLIAHGMKTYIYLVQCVSCGPYPTSMQERKKKPRMCFKS